MRWCAQALDPHVRVVTPTKLIWLMRLRLQPERTLLRALDELARRESEAPPGKKPAFRSQLAKAVAKVRRRDYEGAFRAGCAIRASLP